MGAIRPKYVIFGKPGLRPPLKYCSAVAVPRDFEMSPTIRRCQMPDRELSGGSSWTEACFSLTRSRKGRTFTLKRTTATASSAAIRRRTSSSSGACHIEHRSLRLARPAAAGRDSRVIFQIPPGGLGDGQVEASAVAPLQPSLAKNPLDPPGAFCQSSYPNSMAFEALEILVPAGLSGRPWKSASRPECAIPRLCGCNRRYGSLRRLDRLSIEAVHRTLRVRLPCAKALALRSDRKGSFIEMTVRRIVFTHPFARTVCDRRSSIPTRSWYAPGREPRAIVSTGRVTPCDLPDRRTGRSAD